MLKHQLCNFILFLVEIHFLRHTTTNTLLFPHANYEIIPHHYSQNRNLDNNTEIINIKPRIVKNSTPRVYFPFLPKNVNYSDELSSQYSNQYV